MHPPYAGFWQHLETSGQSRICRQRGSMFNNVKHLPATSLAPPIKSHEEVMLAASSGDNAC